MWNQGPPRPWYTNDPMTSNVGGRPGISSIGYAHPSTILKDGNGDGPAGCPSVRYPHPSTTLNHAIFDGPSGCPYVGNQRTAMPKTMGDRKPTCQSRRSSVPAGVSPKESPNAASPQSVIDACGPGVRRRSSCRNDPRGEERLVDDVGEPSLPLRLAAQLRVICWMYRILTAAVCFVAFCTATTRAVTAGGAWGPMRSTVIPVPVTVTSSTRSPG